MFLSLLIFGLLAIGPAPIKCRPQMICSLPCPLTMPCVPNGYGGQQCCCQPPQFCFPMCCSNGGGGGGGGGGDQTTAAPGPSPTEPTTPTTPTPPTTPTTPTTPPSRRSMNGFDERSGRPPQSGFITNLFKVPLDLASSLMNGQLSLF